MYGPGTTINDWISEIPPVTRFLVMEALLMSIMISLNIVSIYSIVFHAPTIIENHNLARIYLSTTFAGRLGFNLIMQLMFFTNLSSALEKRMELRGKGAQFFWFVILIKILSPLLSVVVVPFTGAPSLFEAVRNAIIYLWSRELDMEHVSFWGFVLPAKQLPLVLVAFDFLVGNPIVVSVLGLAMGHAYYEMSCRPGTRRHLAPPKLVESAYKHLAAFNIVEIIQKIVQIGTQNVQGININRGSSARFPGAGSKVGGK